MEQFECPICKKVINDTSRAKGLHAQEHKITSEEFFCLINEIEPKTCECGCGALTKWTGWKYGYRKNIVGHMSKESRDQGIQKLKEIVKENHWSRGKTKKTSEKLRMIGEKSSKTLKKRFADGEIKHWAKGQNKYTHSSIMSHSKKMSKRMSSNSHWHFYSVESIQEKIEKSLSENFEYKLNIGEIEKRKDNKDKNCLIRIKCKKCGKEYEKTIYDVVRHQKTQFPCLRCREKQGKSKQQQEMTDFVKTITQTNVYENDRSNPTGYEFDVWIPELKVAFEYNGLYWHSDAVNQKKDYHNNKVIKSKEHSISLMHIFEDEWRNKQDIIKSMIKIRLKKADRFVDARKCKIIEIEKTIAKKFLDENHLDGKSNCSKAYALLTNDNDEIVSVITIRNPLSSKWKSHVEIARFASLKNTIVRGGFTKLLKHLLNEHEKILTYVDTRWGSSGNHCKTMKYVGKSRTFWWTDKCERYNRLKCKATSNHTEKEEAMLRGYFKIYGCDILKYVIEKST